MILNKLTSHMTYNVFGGTLNLALSSNLPINRTQRHRREKALFTVRLGARPSTL